MAGWHHDPRRRRAFPVRDDVRSGELSPALLLAGCEGREAARDARDGEGDHCQLGLGGWGGWRRLGRSALAPGPTSSVLANLPNLPNLPLEHPPHSRLHLARVAQPRADGAVEVEEQAAVR